MLGWDTLPFAFERTSALASGSDIRTVQDLLGHASLKTAMVNTHVLGRGLATRSPLDGAT